MERGKYYHILYADEVRLSSLAAQIYGKVTDNLIEEEQTKNIKGQMTGFDLKFAQHKQDTSEMDSAKTSTHYTLRNAQYFEILNELGIDPSYPEEFSEDIIDGELHVLDGELRISGASVMSPILGMMQEMLNQLKKNPMIMGKDKEARQQIEAIKSVVDLLPKVPLPTIFRLQTDDRAIISGPIDEKAITSEHGEHDAFVQREITI